MINGFSVYLIILLLLSGCQAMSGPTGLLNNIPFMKSSEQKEGEAALVAGEYDRAVVLLQQAVGKKPDDKELQDTLNTAQTKAAEAHFSDAEEAERNHDPKLAVEEFEKVLQYQDSTFYRERLGKARDQYTKLSVQVKSVMKDLQGADDWSATLSRAEALMLFQHSFPELEPALQSARGRAGQQLSREADELLKQRKLTKALFTARQAAKLSQTSSYNSQIKALEHMISAREQARNNNFTAALLEVTQARESLPDNSAIVHYQEELLEAGSGQLYNDALRASRSGRYLDAIGYFEALQKLNPDFTDIDRQLRQNRLRFSEQNRLQAEQLEQTEGSEAAGRILIHYLIAQQYAPNSYELEDSVSRARKVLGKEVELRVSIAFANESRERGAGIYVRDRVSDGLSRSDIRNLTVLEREGFNEILREQGMGQGFMDETTVSQVKKIKGIQTGVKGAVLRVAVRESGWARPSYKSVRYESGTRYVPNPGYRSAQADVRSAQQRVYQAQQALNKARAYEQKNTAKYDSNKGSAYNYSALLGNMVAGMDVAGANEDLRSAQYALDDAQDRLANEPVQIEKPVYANARYPIYNLRLDGEVKISFHLIDFTTSEVRRSHVVHITDNILDRYVPGDPGKGIADDPNELPPADVFKEKLLNQAVDETIKKLRTGFASYSQHYLTKAERARERRMKDEAAEYYFRYLSAISEDAGGQTEEARQYIKAQYGVAVAP